MDKSKWEYKKLGEVCEVLDKFRKPVTKSDRVAGQYPYYGATGIQDYVADYIFDGRYLLLGEDGAKWGANENSAFIIEGKSWVNNHAHILKIDDSFMDIFVMYYLNHKDLSEYITGAVVPKLTQAAMLKIPVPNISIADQQRIVAELDCLNEMIALKQEQLKEFDKLAQSIFYDMFGRGASQQQWEQTTIGEIAEEIKYGTSSPATPNGKYKYLRMNNMTNDGYLDLSDLKYIDVDANEYEKYVVRRGDILFNRTNSRELVGKTALFNFDEEMIIAGYIIRVRLKSTADPYYVVRYMNLPEQKTHLRGLCRGAIGQANINAKELQSIPIPLPPLALQQQFAEKIQAIEEQKELVKQSIAETQQLLDSRMDYYFD